MKWFRRSALLLIVLVAVGGAIGFVVGRAWLGVPPSPELLGSPLASDSDADDPALRATREAGLAEAREASPPPHAALPDVAAAPPRPSPLPAPIPARDLLRLDEAPARASTAAPAPRTRTVPADPSAADETALVIRAIDSEPDGDLDRDDLEAAFARCTAAQSKSGCIIELVEGTYADVESRVPPEVVAIRGVGPTSVLAGPSAPSSGPILHRRPRDGGFATRFSDFKIDGRKQSLVSDPGRHNCIRIADSTAKQLVGGVIERVVCENVAQEGFYLDDSPGWILRGNTLQYLGCWDPTGTDQPPWSPNGIDPELMGCGPWGSVQPDHFNQPGSVTPGIGIEIDRNSNGVVISENVVRYFTKIGIQGITGRATPGRSYPRDVVVSGNLVEWGLNGILLVRTRNWTVRDNIVRDVAPPWMYGFVGKGFGCGYAGSGATMIDNLAERTGSVGFDASCTCQPGKDDTEVGHCGILVAGNTSRFSCERYALNRGAFDVFAYGAKGPGRPSGVVLRDNRVIDSSCESAVRIHGFEDVSIEGAAASLSTGTRFGLYVTGSDDIDVDAATFEGQGGGTAIRAGRRTSNLRLHGAPGGTWQETVSDDSVDDGTRVARAQETSP